MLTALEISASSPEDDKEASVTLAKEHTGTSTSATKILGASWVKQNDTLGAECKPHKNHTWTVLKKKGLLKAVLSFWDPLVASMMLLVAKERIALPRSHGTNSVCFQQM